jgi:hypothetical protein
MRVRTTLGPRAAEALRRPEVERIDFQIGDVRVDGMGFGEIAKRIQDSRLKAIWEHEAPPSIRDSMRRSGARNAYYNDPDLMVIRRSPYWYKDVVHESTHALCDMNRLANVRKDLYEAVAYLAQIVFMRLYGDTDRYRRDTPLGAADWMRERFRLDRPPRERPYARALRVSEIGILLTVLQAEYGPRAFTRVSGNGIPTS